MLDHKNYQKDSSKKIKIKKDVRSQNFKLLKILFFELKEFPKYIFQFPSRYHIYCFHNKNIGFSINKMKTVKIKCYPIDLNEFFVF